MKIQKADSEFFNRCIEELIFCESEQEFEEKMKQISLETHGTESNFIKETIFDKLK